MDKSDEMELAKEVREAQIDEFIRTTCAGCEDLDCPRYPEFVKSCMENNE